MNPNNNSYAENMARLTEACANVLDVAEGMNESLAGTGEDVVLSNGMTMPSYNNVMQRLERAENTVSKFVQGHGVVETNDGTYRQIKATAISRPPERIKDLSGIEYFGINPNWFFESLQYPRCIVRLSLTGKIEDDSDRVLVKRIMLDYSGTAMNGAMSMKEFYETYIKDQDMYYSQMISLFQQYSVEYKEDEDEVKLPLTYEQYQGLFNVSKISLIRDSSGVSREWYILDTLNYSKVDSDGAILNNEYKLKTGDYLRINDALFEITDVDDSINGVRLKYSVGYQTIAVNDDLELYNDPFSDKSIEIGIGIDEYNIIYVKGVNENYNLVSAEWSSPISFLTNELVFEEDEYTKFDAYHKANVADFGRKLISDAKERHISAYDGLVPYAPTLNVNDLKVVQINTQLNATLESEEYNNITSEINSVKSNMQAIRTTIAKNKDLLVQTTTAAERAVIQNNIISDTNTYNTLSTEYASLVDSLSTLLKESNSVNYTPKYHIRGFFAIPKSRYEDEANSIGEQAVIGFEIKYRYIHTDETGVRLDSYEYTDTDNVRQTGVFSDWNQISTEVLEKTYDASTGKYVWIIPSTSDGTEVNINQIDIAIRSGEKVEIKVRSISEAGYPYSPLKSDWSNSVIVAFPENLSSEDTASSVLSAIESDKISVTLQQTLTAAGVYTHLGEEDSTYRHTAASVSFAKTDTSTNTTQTISVQDALKDLLDRVTKLEQSNP